MSEDTMYMEFDPEEPISWVEPEDRTEEINRLAIETIHGKHGRVRKDREASLGELYQDVMAEVIRIRLQGA